MSNKTIPNHLGLILDGNRRWAKAHGLPTFEGHRLGYDNLKDIVRAAVDRGINYVSAFIFSTENWDRTPREVKYLMQLAYTMLTRDVDELNKEQIRVVWLGSPLKLSQRLLAAIKKAEELTQNNKRGTLCICLNYGGIQELVDMTKSVIKQSNLAEDVDQSTLEANLYHPEVPAVDLMLRTSGEQRLSGFMLFRAAYAEIMFINEHWPDFKVTHLDKALAEFGRRQRRFGT